MGFRLNQPNQPGPANEQLKGVTRLVTPRSDDKDIVSGDEEQDERDYVGRILHVADRALRQFKQSVFHRMRRSRIH